MIRLALPLLFFFAPLTSSSLVFVHIPKTAGTTLTALLDNQFPQEEIYPYIRIGKDRITTTSSQVAAQVLQEYPDIDHPLIRGHFPMWFLKEKDPDYHHAYYFTVLRDPIERVLSEAGAKSTKNRPYSPLQITPNLMCRVLSTNCTLRGEKLLENAIQSLHRMDCILFFDDLESGVDTLFKNLGLTLASGRLPQKNPTQFRIQKDPLLVEKIRKINSLDVRLYEYAKTHLYSQRKILDSPAIAR